MHQQGMQQGLIYTFTNTDEFYQWLNVSVLSVSVIAAPYLEA